MVLLTSELFDLLSTALLGRVLLLVGVLLLSSGVGRTVPGIPGVCWSAPTVLFGLTRVLVLVGVVVLLGTDLVVCDVADVLVDGVLTLERVAVLEGAAEVLP